MRVFKSSAVAAVAAVAAISIGLAPSAHADPFGFYKSADVSCDATTIKTVGHIWPMVDGEAKLQQGRATNPDYETIVWFRDSAGNETGKGRIRNGQAVAWNLPWGTWAIRALKASASNCNGALPGHGNYYLELVVFHA